MFTRTKLFGILLSLFSGIMFFNSHAAMVADSVTMYTPYTKISVPPGESIDYTIDVINKSNKRQNLEIAVVGIPKGWNYFLKSGGWNIEQLAILPGERKSLMLNVEVPFLVAKGNYRFKVIAGGISSLPLIVNVSKQGTFKTEFTTDQSNMQGYASSNFTFTADLKNRTTEKQLYALLADTPPGWVVTFKANYKQVTSVDIESNSNEKITIEIKPPNNIAAGTYGIPVKAATNSSTANLVLQVVISGSFGMELTTPSGLLSGNITAGEEKRIEMLVKNTASSDINDLNLTYTAPTNWIVKFDPQKVDKLLSGGEAHVFVTIKADKKAIPGDYLVKISAKTPEVSSEASFRISVKTPMLWGWIGLLIIIFALGSVYYLFRKYGRR